MEFQGWKLVDLMTADRQVWAVLCVWPVVLFLVWRTAAQRRQLLRMDERLKIAEWKIRYESQRQGKIRLAENDDDV